MLDLSRFEGDSAVAELVEEIKDLRRAGARLSEVAQIVAAEHEPLHPDCVKCEQFDQVKAREALAAWRAVHE